MNSTLNIRMEIPAHLADDMQEILKGNEIAIKQISDGGGLKDVMTYFNIAVGMSSIVALGLQIYELLRNEKRKIGKSHIIKIEFPGDSDQPLSLEIDPGKAKPIISIQLENIKKALEQNQ